MFVKAAFTSVTHSRKMDTISIMKKNKSFSKGNMMVHSEL